MDGGTVSVGETDHDELGFYQERPLNVRLTEFVVIFTGLVFIWPPMFAVWGGVLIFGFIFVFSSPIRHAGIGFGGDSILVVAMLLGIVATMLIPRRFYSRIFYGRPWFGKLSDLSKALVRTVLRASGELSFNLDNHNRQLMQQLADLNRAVTKWSMGRRYQENHSDQAGDGTTAVETQWNNIWQEQVLKSSSGGRTLAQTFEPDSYSSATVPLRLTSVVAPLAVLTGVCEVVAVWILLSRLESRSSLLPVFQVVVAFSVATTLVIFINHNYKLPYIQVVNAREILQQYRPTLMPKTRRQAEEAVRALEEEFGERLASFEDVSISVIGVKVSPRYFGLIRNYYARSLAYESVSNSVTGFVLIAAATGFLLVFGAGNESNLGRLYTQLAIALVLMPVAMVGIHFLIFTIVAQFRTFSTLVITGGIIAFIPPLATYLFTGRLPASPIAFVSSVVVALIGSAGADLALHSRKRIIDRSAKS
jgi:hypothetical protein